MAEAGREHLAFAADLPLPEAQSIYERIAPHVGFAKVGLSLFVEHGPAAVEAFRALGAKVFLDLKLHDIPNTVELAAAHAGELGVALLTVHAQGGARMLAAAVEGARSGAARRGLAPPRILAVTVLTSLGDADLAQLGVTGTAAEQAVRLARVAIAAGADGLVCSAREVALLRSELGPAPFLCTPGIRPAGAAAGDQARVETPKAALIAGANLLVVGRPIYGAPDPEKAAASIAAELG